MSKTYTNAEQQAEIVKYISDNMKLPLIGAGGGFAPIGTINFFDASIAPQGWLACDGTVYNIADYPDLATYYASVHSASNFYGGDGITTFAVPDLRGEFLRGTGTNSHTNQGSGANVGVHQDGTKHSAMTSGGNQPVYLRQASELNYSNGDYTGREDGNYQLLSGSKGTSTGYPVYTSRPTNTSFLICVKATVAGDPNGHVYSTEEQVVGQWIDGKPVYEKTINFGALPNNDKKTVAHNIANIERFVDVSFMFDDGTYAYSAPLVSNSSLNGQTPYYVDRQAVVITTKTDYSSCTGYAHLRYTKTTD